MDLWHKFTTFIDHNRYTSLAGGVVIALVSLASGCESTTSFLGVEMTRSQVEQTLIQEKSELEAAYARLDAKRDALVAAGTFAASDLDAKDARREVVFATLGELALSAATGGATTPTLVAGGVTLASVLFGVGAGLDNRRKDKKISETSA